jgi:transcriptional regulator with XRE-family HTH domain
MRRRGRPAKIRVGAEGDAGWSEREDEGEAGRPALELAGGSPVLMRVGSNLGDERAELGLTTRQVATRAKVTVQHIRQIEKGDRLPQLLLAMRLAGAYERPVDALLDGVFWNPGEHLPQPPRGRPTLASAEAQPRPGSERLRGYFSILPLHEPVFERAATRVIVGDRRSMARRIGQNIREVRERRGVPQAGLGFEQAQVSRIERGLQEPFFDTLVEIARRLEVPPGLFMDGMDWGIRPLTGPGLQGHRGRLYEYHSKDGEVARLWRAGATTSGIAEELGLSGKAVGSIVGRLRREGRNLPLRGPGGRGREDVDQDDEVTAADFASEFLRRRDERSADVETVPADEVLRLVSAKVKEERTRRDYLQTQLAERVGLYATQISAQETRGSDSSLGLYMRLAGSLGVTLTTLTAGIRWDHALQSFVVGHVPVAESAAARMAANARRIRRASGLSIATVGRRAGMSDGYFGAFELGYRTARPATILMLAGVLGVEVEALLEGVCDWYVRPLSPAARQTAAERAAARAADQAVVLRMWDEGATLPDIGEAVDMQPKAVAAMIDRLRGLGVAVPYRRRPRSASELALRMRRRRSGSAAAARGPAITAGDAAAPYQGSSLVGAAA